MYTYIKASWLLNDLGQKNGEKSTGILKNVKIEYSEELVK